MSGLAEKLGSVTHRDPRMRISHQIGRLCDILQSDREGEIELTKAESRLVASLVESMTDAMLSGRFHDSLATTKADRFVVYVRGVLDATRPLDRVQTVAECLDAASGRVESRGGLTIPAAIEAMEAMRRPPRLLCTSDDES